MPIDLNELSGNLKESIIFSKNKNQENVLSMNVDDISGVLRKIESILHGYIEYLNNHEDVLEENRIKISNCLFFQYFLSELSDNFFPMAHTKAPLRNLKIICDTIPENDANRLRDQYRDFYLRSQEYSEMLKRIIQEQQSLIENLVGDFNTTMGSLNIPIDR
jgi:hypothetical protein